MAIKFETKNGEIKTMTTPEKDARGMLEFAAQQEREKIKVIDIGQCGQVPVAFLSDGFGKTVPVDLSDIVQKNAQRPKRKKLTLSFYDVDSFIEYINQQKTSDTRIFCLYGQVPNVDRLKAIIDFHGVDDSAANWCEHEAILHLTPTHEWQAWKGSDNKAFGQLAFAQFLEENMLDVINPPAADLMEVVQNLTIKTDVAYRSQVNLDNGDVQFLFENTSQPGGPKGTIEFPTRFELNIPVLEGSDPTPLKARFRYKRVDSVLSFSYHMIQADKLYRSVVDVMLDKVQKGTKCTVFNGFAR